jgi:hypothetical protein
MKKFGTMIILAVVAMAFAGCGESGEKLWGKACDHMVKAAKSEGGDKIKDEALKGLKDKCTAGFKSTKDPKEADKLAKCILSKKKTTEMKKCAKDANKDAKKKDDKKVDDKKVDDKKVDDKK